MSWVVDVDRTTHAITLAYQMGSRRIWSAPLSIEEADKLWRQISGAMLTAKIDKHLVSIGEGPKGRADG